MNCTNCKNHYLGKNAYCWSGNKVLGYCNYNGVPNDNAKVYSRYFSTLKTIKDIRR